MVANRVARGLGFLWLASGAFACASPQGVEGGASNPEGPPAEIAAVTNNGLIGNGLIGNGLIGNGLIGNGLIGNGLVGNGLVGNGLVGNGLTTNGLVGNGLVGNGANAGVLSDPAAREFLKYVVSCALNSQQSLTFAVGGTTYTLSGEMGLAPQWGFPNGSCDGSCQRWVSACVLSRVDAAGVHREISIRGLNPALRPTWTELIQYTKREATYFGNLFIAGQPRFVCLSPGQTQDERACGPSLADCPMTVVGSCDQDCIFQGPLGDFELCSDAGRSHSGQTYLESITVYLPK
jgi:hypothetical protein